MLRGKLQCRRSSNFRSGNVSELNENGSWSSQEVDGRLHEIMCNIHGQCVKYGKREDGYVDYVRGANIAGFLKVASASARSGSDLKYRCVVHGEIFLHPAHCNTRLFVDFLNKKELLIGLFSYL